MAIIGELPLSELSGLVSYAEAREEEEAARPLYIAHFMLQKMNGADPMGYEEYLKQVLGGEGGGKTSSRSAEEIENELGRLEKAYRARKEEA